MKQKLISQVAIIPSLEMQSSIIFCEDCKEEITTVMEHLKSYSLTDIILQPIGKQFEDHLDHNVCILTPFNEDFVIEKEIN